MIYIIKVWQRNWIMRIFIQNLIMLKLMLKIIIITINIQVILRQIYSMEEQINYHSNYVMIIAMNAMK